MTEDRKKTILVVDDLEMNRAILMELLGDEYNYIEAEDGVQAVSVLERMGTDIDLVLLDIVMPNMDGFSVLETMNRNKWIDDIPVIVVSGEKASLQVERAYELGVTDFIARPYDMLVVRRRVTNTLLLYAKQKKLIGFVEDQIYEKEKNNSVMVDILSHIMEFRNGESGLHVRHVRTITDFLLRKLTLYSDRYPLTEEEITMTSIASALHDIGKIGIDEKILNKPGKLNDAEYEIMKTHSIIGAKMLDGLALHQGNPLIRTAYDICRWHHERYDGRGYPDGLVGDEIPISAQVVALADVYDALTSDRVYKALFDHETAVAMILNGECGAFNPDLLEVLREYAPELRLELADNVAEEMNRREIRSFASAALNSLGGGAASEHALTVLDYERIKNSFFSGASEEIRFEYTMASHIFTLSSWSVRKTGAKEIIINSGKDSRIQDVISGINWQELTQKLVETTPEHPEISFEEKINCDGEPRWHRILVRAVWTAEAPHQCVGALGRAVDIHEARTGTETP